jgi:hypothetical protein
MTAYHFFLKHAGYSYDPKTETPMQGRIKTAHKLAQAEKYAKNHDWIFEWGDDWDDPKHCDKSNGDGTEYKPKTCEYCYLYNDVSDVLASLSCIDDADADYRRVVEAELALEAMGND